MMRHRHTAFAFLVSTCLAYVCLVNPQLGRLTTDLRTSLTETRSKLRVFSKTPLSKLFMILRQIGRLAIRAGTLTKFSIDFVFQPLLRWRPLEAALASIGSQAESILDCIDDETGSGREKPIDIESLLVKVIPSLLGLCGMIF